MESHFGGKYIYSSIVVNPNQVYFQVRLHMRMYRNVQKVFREMNMKLAQVLKEEHVYMMCIPEMHNVCGVGCCQGGPVLCS